MWRFFSIGNWSLIGFYVGGVLGVILVISLCFLDVNFLCDLGYFTNYFVFDSCIFVLGILTLLLWFIIWVLCGGGVFIHISVVSALFCYICLSSFMFWFFYELSIVSALLLLIKESPYPERYNAGWYFGGYVILSGVPLLLSILLLSLFEGSSDFVCWTFEGGACILGWLMCLMFITKIPLPPFHVWLPLVHAEASSPTSIILSGYIMKLGVLGLLRFGGGVLNSDLFLLIFILLCSFSLLFMLSSYLECDAKRWLAMMSLFHILVSIVLCGCGVNGYEVFSLLYCFGHGIAAGTAFVIIWWGYGCVFSRNWGVLFEVLGGVLGVQMVVGVVFLCVAGFPTTLQFVMEVLAMVSLLSMGDYFILLLVGLFVFGGSLIVLVILGGVITSIGVIGGVLRLGLDSYIFSLVVICIFGFLLVFIM